MPGLERTSPIRIFLAACRTGSFASAALELNLTPSAIAKSIARLEQRLAVKLFERTTRSLSMTQEAVRYRAACQRLVDDLDATEAELAAANATPSGVLRVTLPPVLGTEIIAPALFALSDRFPLLSVDIDLGVEILDLPLSPFDLAVRVGHLPDTPGLTRRHVGTQRTVVCASAHYLEVNGVPGSIDDLLRHNLIATSHHGRIIPWSLIEASGERQSWAPPARLHLDGSVLTLQAIRSGRGIGCVPEWMAASDLASGRIRTLMGSTIGDELPIQVVWPSSSVMLPRLRFAIDAIVQAMKSAGHNFR
jgi:DNA-binding transcriptional LysR family regulator